MRAGDEPVSAEDGFFSLWRIGNASDQRLAALRNCGRICDFIRTLGRYPLDAFAMNVRANHNTIPSAKQTPGHRLADGADADKANRGAFLHADAIE